MQKLRAKVITFHNKRGDRKMHYVDIGGTWYFNGENTDLRLSIPATDSGFWDESFCKYAPELKYLRGYKDVMERASAHKLPKLIKFAASLGYTRHTFAIREWYA